MWGQVVVCDSEATQVNCSLLQPDHTTGTLGKQTPKPTETSSPPSPPKPRQPEPARKTQANKLTQTKTQTNTNKTKKKGGGGMCVKQTEANGKNNKG